MLAGTYILPAYAVDRSEPGPLTISSKAGVVQTLVVPTSESAVVSMSRDSFTIVKAADDLRPYEFTSDTFVNNPNSAIQWPFTVGVPITSWYGFRPEPCAGCGSWHAGIDMAPGEGTPIQSIADGVVVDMGSGGSSGVFVTIEHRVDGQVVRSWYKHMLDGSVPLTLGESVRVGQTVGQVGQTGLSTGPHLHFEILLDGTTTTDPYAWLKSKVSV